MRELTKEESKPFVAGQWAYSIESGWGKISFSILSTNYPIICSEESYTESGLFNSSNKHPSLFHTDIFNGTQPPEPEIDWDKVPRDTSVEVRDSPIGAWYGGYFSHKSDDTYYCFEYHQKSKDAKSIDGWGQCRLINKSDIEKYSK